MILPIMINFGKDWINNIKCIILNVNKFFYSSRIFITLLASALAKCTGIALPICIQRSEWEPQNLKSIGKPVIVAPSLTVILLYSKIHDTTDS